MKHKNALVAGATGLVGFELIKLLLDDELYSKVCLAGRRPFPIEHEKIVDHQIDFDQIQNLHFPLDIDDVFVCLGTTMKKAGSKEAFKRVDYQYVYEFAQWSKANGAKSFGFVSSIGAKAASRNFYLKVKGEAEEQVAALAIPNSYALRPSVIKGDREEKRFLEKLSIRVLELAAPLLKGRLLKYRTVEAKQIAKTMIDCAAKEGEGFHIVENDAILEVNK